MEINFECFYVELTKKGSCSKTIENMITKVNQKNITQNEV